MQNKLKFLGLIWWSLPEWSQVPFISRWHKDKLNYALFSGLLRGCGSFHWWKGGEKGQWSWLTQPLITQLKPSFSIKNHKLSKCFNQLSLYRMQNQTQLPKELALHMIYSTESNEYFAVTTSSQFADWNLQWVQNANLNHASYQLLPARYYEDKNINS